MNQRREIERCRSRGGEIQLAVREGVPPIYEVVSNGTFLMSSERTASEVALARLVLAEHPRKGPIRVLVAGLGLGITLRVALDDPRIAEAVVVELEESVVRWNRTHLRELNGGALADPRVRVVSDDFLAFLGLAPEAGHRPAPDTEAGLRPAPDNTRFDAILVDVDNGPDWLVEPANAPLYGASGLAALAARTASGGAVGIWSADPAPALVRALGVYFEDSREEIVAAAGPGGRSLESAIAIAIRPRAARR